jgi:hypothetical protein
MNDHGLVGKIASKRLVSVNCSSAQILLHDGCSPFLLFIEYRKLDNLFD